MIVSTQKIDQPKDPGGIRGVFRKINKNFIDFCDRTSIHGLQYISKKDRTTPERVFWIVFLAFVSFLCIILLKRIYINWINTPIVLSFANEPGSISDIPFPAVTICSDIFVMNPKRFTNKDICVKETASIIFNSICSSEFSKNTQFPKLSKNCSLEKFSKDSMISMLPDNVAGNFFWDAEGQSVDIILTETGICQTFNLMAAKDIFRDDVLHESLILRTSKVNKTTKWSLSKGYSSRKETYPHRVFFSGLSEALLSIVSVSIPKNAEACTASNIEGFSIMVHSPIDYPSVWKDKSAAPFQSSTIVLIKPDIIESAEEVRFLPPKQRHCYFEYENVLRFFKYYTESNCELECLTNYTLTNCGCVPAYLPRLKGTRICRTKTEVICYKDAPHHLEHTLFRDKHLTSVCECLPNCHIISYGTEAISSTLSTTETKSKNSKTYASANIITYFIDDQFWAARRSKLYSTMDLIASFGGIMGLCMGVSIVSIIEFVYFFTVRFTTAKKCRPQPKKTAQEEYLNPPIEMNTM